MIRILRAYGIPKTVTDTIEDTYTNTKAKEISPDGETKLFDIAPYLFIITLDYCLRNAISGSEEELGFTIKPRQSRRIGPKVVTDLDFADDISLISNTIEQAQIILNEVENAALPVGLHMNASKTKCMFFNQDQNDDIHTLDGSKLEVVTDFKYLGAWIGSSQHDIQVRKALVLEIMQCTQ